jgi:O-antigen/teichoic acid export membrane protein
VSTCVGSTLRLLLLVALIPLLGFVGPAAAFLCAETAVVTIWMVQLARLGFRAKLSDVIWRPLTAGVAMTLVLFAARDATLLWQLGAAGLAVVVYALVLLALKTFSVEEVLHAREGLAFFSPFVASWAKKLKRNS